MQSADCIQYDDVVGFQELLVMGDTRIFNSIPILLRSVSADTDTYFDTKINIKFQFSIPEVST